MDGIRGCYMHVAALGEGTAQLRIAAVLASHAAIPRLLHGTGLHAPCVPLLHLLLRAFLDAGSAGACAVAHGVLRGAASAGRLAAPLLLSLLKTLALSRLFA